MDPPIQTTSSTQRVTASRAGMAKGSTIEQDIEIARFVARLMDSSFEVAGVKFGLDSLIGLIPVAGDAITLGVGLYPILLARKHKLGKLVIARMMGNLGVDFVTGLVPIAGDAFDVFFKANLKNLKLLEDAAAKRAIR